MLSIVCCLTTMDRDTEHPETLQENISPTESSRENISPTESSPENTSDSSPDKSSPEKSVSGHSIREAFVDPLSEKDVLTPQQAKKLRFSTSLGVGLQIQAICASHIICRDVISSGSVGIQQWLEPRRYEWSITCLYFPYAVLPIVSVFLFKRSNPRVFLGAEMFLWGLNCLLFAFVHNYGGMIVARLFLGLLLNFGVPSMLYVVYEHHGRFNGQFVLACAWGVSWFLVPCFAMIAIALGLIHDGKAGWQWMFIVTGTAGCLQSALVYLTLPDYFYSSRWIRKHGLAAYEYFKEYSEADYCGGNPVEPAETLVEGLVSTLKDPLVWGCGVLGLFTMYGIGSSYSQLMSYTLSSLHFSPAEGQLVIWPVMFTSMVWCLLQAWFSGKLRVNYVFLLSNYIFAIVGWAMTLGRVSDHNLWVKYGGAWFVLPNMVASFVTTACWLGSNVQGRNRRLMSFTVFAMIVNWYGVLEFRTFVHNEIPLFHRSIWIDMGFMIGACFLSTALFLWLRWRNMNGGGWNGFMYVL
ncbi:putative transporter C11D3.18C [Yarrowia sp. B02]|nr:putative transporter C11D3.18C [Yarrowia sp. B02]